ncbi:hypothetical protein [Streptomyces sp. NPDC048565]|uniref:hypothetical protein n=1 Tax=Streptomyces sp. NPDC048565 TaxID=3155266 RepID=UPI0034144E65
MVQKPQNDAERRERRIDLSLPQVAGSAVAAVAAAVMASQLGVYGTIAGAGVMSVVATCGGSVFQHFFRRTGEQIREVTVQAKSPAGRQVSVRTRETPLRSQQPQQTRQPQDDATRVLRQVGVEDDATRVLRTAETGTDRTTMLRQVRPGEARPGGKDPGAPPDPRPGDALKDDSCSDYSEALTHGTPVRGWKRSALAATGVFVLSMAGITVYEMVSGHDLGGNGGTTIGSVVSGERHGGTTSPSPSDGTDRKDDGNEGGQQDDGDVPGSGTTTSPGTDEGTGHSTGPDPAATDGAVTGPTPTPSASDGDTTPDTTAPTTPGDAATTPAAPDPTGAGEAQEQQGGAESGTGTDR